MNNTAHVLASFNLLLDTDLTEKEFKNTFHPDVIINSKVIITLPDGRVHTASFAELVGIRLKEFENNKEATDGEISDQLLFKQQSDNTALPQ